MNTEPNNSTSTISIMEMDYVQFVNALQTNTLPEPTEKYDAEKDGILEIKQDVYSGFYDWAYKNRNLLNYITIEELTHISPSLFYPTVNNEPVIDPSTLDLRKYSVGN